jgi:Ca2+-binding EF-hand superfamily protein
MLKPVKKYLSIFVILIFALRLLAQSNGPVRLALIAETGEASAAADVLTAQLSSNPKIHLLERNEVEKVYREQSLSAGNKDYLKLGRILGADGLLLFNVVRTPQTTNFTARLIAVKPGVILTDGSFPWPLKDTLSWAESVAPYLNSFLPKLAVLVKDAIPVSVVNLRSAIQSAEAQETERQLKLLAIQRLSQERQFFVLERQRMQLLSEEKELKADESAFWNGSYLVEGVVDQNGYSRETVTINARLTPPKGGTPLVFEVSGSRTNFTDVINRLAAKVTELLKVNSAVKEWNAADEAAQYFDEAKWALKWGVLAEAQAAADSAWALGKQDEDCATVRIKAYVNSTGGMIIEGSGIDCSIVDSGEESARNDVIRYIKRDLDTHAGAVFAFGARGIDAVLVDNSPDKQSLDHAIRALELYYAFSGLLSSDGPKTNSAWYGLGIESLTAAAKVLQHFFLVPQSQGAVVDKLAELRALARSVAMWISRSPSVHDSYFVPDRNPDEERRRVLYQPNIFHCKVNWGCFWQERPEDCVALYRELLDSPLFAHFNDEFGSAPGHPDSRGLERPRLIAWNGADRKRIPSAWNSFVRELNASTNRFWQAEAQIFKDLDPVGMNAAEVMAKYSEYWQEMASGKQDTLAIRKQKKYLVSNRPFDYDEFEDTFIFRDYTKAQALKIAPLLIAYKANLVTQINELNVTTFEDAIKRGRGDTYASDVNKRDNWQTGLKLIDKLQAKLDGILGTSSSKPVAAATPSTPNSKSVKADQPLISPNTTAALSPVDAPILAKRFFKIPQEQFWTDVFVWPGEEASHGISNEKVIAHRWREGRLVLDLRYYCTPLAHDGQSTRGAVALLNPTNGRWEIVRYPQGGQYETSPVEMFRGSLYLMEDHEFIMEGNQVGHKGRIIKYDSKTGRWEPLKIPEQGIFQLTTVNDSLFAANSESILEITDSGRGTRVLASTRRRPAASALDALSGFGAPILYSGANGFLCAIVGKSTHVWDGKDWRKEIDLNDVFPANSSAPWEKITTEEIFDDALLFRTIPLSSWELPQSLWILHKTRTAPELALYKKPGPPPWMGENRKPADPPQKPLWSMPETNFLVRNAMAYCKSNLYCFIDHSQVKIVDGHKTAEAQDGYHARLVCLSRDCPEPMVVPLKFDLQQGPPPIENFHDHPRHSWDGSGKSSQSTSWMYFADNYLFIGEEHTLGVWAIPVSEVEAAIAEQKQIVLTRLAQEHKRAVAAEEQHRKDLEQRRKSLLAKYDHNQNGVIDPEEKMEALDDPAFIESELDAIDTNHNGRLEAEELAWFDSNQNKILEPKEQAGIEIAQQLLAARLLKEFDANSDGLLDSFEFNNLWLSVVESSISRYPNIPFPDENRDGRVDVGELATFLNQQTRGKIHVPGMSRAALYEQMGIDLRQQRVDPRQMFKAAVELYWQHPDGITNEPHFNRKTPPGRVGVTNDMQNGKTP